MTRVLAQIPDPTPDTAGMLNTLRALRETVHILSGNAYGSGPGSGTDQLFARAATVGRTAASAATVDAGADATVQFTLTAPSDIIVAFGNTGIAASAAGNLIVSVDGNDTVTVPLAITGGNAYPMSAFTLISNLGIGPHSITVRASTGITGMSIAVIGSTR